MEQGADLTVLAKLGLIAIALSLPFVWIRCVLTHATAIAAAVREHVSSALPAADISNAAVGVDGRDIILTGFAASEDAKKRARELAEAAAGVRTVDNRIVVQAESAAVGDAKTVQRSIDKILLDRKIEFATNDDTLLPGSVPVLEDVAKVLQQAPGLAVRIEGHTDNTGAPGVNRALSQDRAQVVLAWLANHGVSRDHMTAAGFGSTKPIASNETSTGRYVNRRVEIIAQ